MSFLRLNHIFGLLMVLALVTAFVLPQRVVQSHVPAVDLLFVPVSRPAGAVARSLHDAWVAPDLSKDTRSAEVVRRENESLKIENMSLQTRLKELEEREGSRKLVGPIRPYCMPFPVVATDSGTRLSLGIQGSELQGLRDGMIAVYPLGVVGTVERGVAGARVKLATDSDFKVGVEFLRSKGTSFVRLKPESAVAQGTGKGAMYILTRLTHEQAAELQVMDWVAVKDANWPRYIQGYALGRIVSIGPDKTAPLFEKIVIEPSQNLLRLNEVLVVTKLPGKTE